MRDLGGYRTATGQQTRSNLLIRSGNLDKLTVDARKQLEAYGVKSIVDVRDEWEVDHYPNAFASVPTVDYHNLPLLGDALSNDEAWQQTSKDYVHLHELYIKYLEQCKVQIARIITKIVESDAITICHCHAGKDRTGIIIALILSMVGVSHEDIAHDYSLSRQEIEHLVQEWRDYAIETGRDLAKVERGASSTQQTMLTMLDYIEQEYDSTEHYLQTCGVSSVTIAQLNSRFLV